jgi:hypothetical protein
MTSKRETVTQMPARNADELRARMAAAGSGFGATCPKCGGDVAPIMLENWGHCLKCKVA